MTEYKYIHPDHIIVDSWPPASLYLGTHEIAPGVVVTHKPTNMAIQCVHERDQARNRAFALRTLSSALGSLIRGYKANGEPIFDSRSGTIVTQALVLCTKCKKTIITNRGPMLGSLCVECYERFQVPTQHA